MTPDPKTAERRAAMPEWLPDTVFPFALHTLSRPAGAVTYLDEGDGPVLLFVHVGMWSLVWRDVIMRLRDQFRCVVVEAPGTGLSPRTTTNEPTVANAAIAIEKVVEALHLESFVLVFHDLGGPAALLAVASWPQRVQSIVAVNTFGWRPSGVLFPFMLTLMGSTLMRVIDVLTGVVPRLSVTRFGVGRHLSRDDRRAFLKGMDRRGRDAFHRYMRSARPTDTPYDAIERTTRILADRPLLTIFGQRNDPGRFQRKWMARFAATTAVVVAKGYHFPMCDAPDVVASAIAEFATERS